MNRTRYTSDPRYSKVLDDMDLLGITDISTKRQEKNGTIVWRLPIKNNWGGSFIEVASFKTGYVRNQNSGYSNYQLNKRNYKDEYFKDYKIIWNDNNTDYTQEWTGKYKKFRTKTCILIPVEIDRLEYLISYCLKNYYIKHANQVANGEYIPKWRHESLMKGTEGYYKDKVNDCGHYERIKDLENKLEEANSTYGNNTGAMVRIDDLQGDVAKWKDKYKKLDDFYKSSKAFNDSMYEGRNDKVKELEDKLEKCKKTYYSPREVSVTIDGQRYKVI